MDHELVRPSVPMLREGSEYESCLDRRNVAHIMSSFLVLGDILKIQLDRSLRSRSRWELDILNQERKDMFTVYIIYSETIDQYYSGHSKDVEDRLHRHNAGKSLATKRGISWDLKKAVNFETRSEAMRAENWIKKMKSRKVIEKVISGEIDLRKVIESQIGS